MTVAECVSAFLGSIWSAGDMTLAKREVVRGSRRMFFRTSSIAMLTAFCLGCDGDSPVSPTGTLSFAGTWTGTTSQGGSISFTVSPAQRVVMVRSEYRLNGCVGTALLTDVAFEIAKPQLAPGSPTSGGPFDNPSFGSASQGLDQPNYFAVGGTFVSSTQAIGTLVFGQYAGCGSGSATWQASTR